ncbi:hypothetical protein KPH14_003077 [Odynerus spinipes]|uniref:Uncharacterized protein n=1 Tax=Odynerus spinipes TaxID=1348599 RepID=A0AAD9VVD1_9HYME|nr:hypothetical protein KPH14_003077 [Odynerus spinipes]
METFRRDPEDNPVGMVIPEQAFFLPAALHTLLSLLLYVVPAVILDPGGDHGDLSHLSSLLNPESSVSWTKRYRGERAKEDIIKAG